MPGIVAIIANGLSANYRSDLKLMIDSMMHEPFYRNGLYIDASLGVYAGWVCHPDSYADCMPVMNEKKDVVLLFAGEDFSDQSVSSSNRASALLQRYENEGEGF